MKTFPKLSISIVGVCLGALLTSGCATGQKRMEPVGAKQAEEKLKRAEQQSEFLKRIAELEQPALEPDWADFVKDHFPSWRNHYWVDRGAWGNRGYIVGKAPSTSQPIVEEIAPLPPAPPISSAPAIIPTEEPKIETPDRPTKYVVKKGDSLWRIAGKVYGNPLKWPRIYRANQDKIKNPHKIYPNQVLTIPWD